MKSNLGRLRTGIVLLVAMLAVEHLNAQEATSRAPFVLELPGVSNERYKIPFIRLSQKDLPKLKIRVVEPYAPKIDYGKVIITLNGNGINGSCSLLRDEEGKFRLCVRKEKDKYWGYDLAPGKNILEVRATDTDGRDFYASYVLILGDKTILGTTPAPTGGKTERFTGRKYAIVIGISEYRFTDAGLLSLKYAADDANAVADFLKTPEGGKFSVADIKLLLNKDATINAIRAALRETAERAGPEDLIFIFIAGHGAPDPISSQQLYFLLYDTKVVDMEHTAFPMADLKAWFDKINVKRVIVFIDTCHSAGVNQQSRSLVTGRQLTQPGDENNISNFTLSNQLFKEKGRAIITSSDVNEVSLESSKWGNHGVFTWALLQGLSGAADLNNDNLVTTGELFKYTQATVRSATNSEQNPIALPGSSANLALAIVKKKSK